MAADGSRGPRRPPRRESGDDAGETARESNDTLSRWILLGMPVIALGCLAAGSLRHGLEWRGVLAAAACLAAGIGFVAIGLLELEWLERIVGFAGGIWSGLAGWFWTTQSGTLSEDELIGRGCARVIWVVCGVAAFIVGCLMAVRVIAV